MSTELWTVRMLVDCTLDVRAGSKEEAEERALEMFDAEDNEPWVFSSFVKKEFPCP